MILRNKKGQMTGELRDGIYEQSLKRTAHSFHSQGLLAIDTEHFERLKMLGATHVRKTFDNGETFTATLEDFKEYGFSKQWTIEDGEQTFLAEKHWSYRNENQMALF